ncbi:MAG: helix-turn-helix transcriptional regulator [Candidatus Pacebacteria bacterium]|nr:helix-turn-helix transcriptional regulator [Candidatus Paceibacterota bacterium]
MKLPELTHLQFVVVNTLTDEPTLGSILRTSFAHYGSPFDSGPAFYQFMKRLEASNFIKGQYDTHMHGKQIIRQRKYTLTKKGEKAIRDLKLFYAHFF